MICPVKLANKMSGLRAVAVKQVMKQGRKCCGSRPIGIIISTAQTLDGWWATIGLNAIGTSRSEGPLLRVLWFESIL